MQTDFDAGNNNNNNNNIERNSRPTTADHFLVDDGVVNARGVRPSSCGFSFS